MKFTLSWLKEHLETDATLDEICARLTMIGLEVDAVDDKAAFKPFVIAKVLSAEKATTGEGDAAKVVYEIITETDKTWEMKGRGNTCATDMDGAV